MCDVSRSLVVNITPFKITREHVKTNQKMTVESTPLPSFTLNFEGYDFLHEHAYKRSNIASTSSKYQKKE